MVVDRMACQTRLPHCVTGSPQRTVTSLYANTEDGRGRHHGSPIFGSADFRSIGLALVIAGRVDTRARFKWVVDPYDDRCDQHCVDGG